MINDGNILPKIVHKVKSVITANRPKRVMPKIMPKVVIMVMRARQIEESLKTISALPFPKVWVEYHWETEIMEEFPSIVDEAMRRGFTHLSIVSDDGVIDDVKYVYTILEAALQHRVVCGWCYDSRERDVFPKKFTNMVKTPLTSICPVGQGVHYDLYRVKDILRHPQPKFRTWFSGMTFHTMTLKMWKRYPFQCFVGPKGRGYASDYHLCKRLQDDGVSIVGLRDGSIRHLGLGISTQTEKKLYCGGLRPKKIRWDV